MGSTSANHRKTIPLYLQDNHYSSLDGFRAVSIIAVVYGHVYFNEDNLINQYFSGDWGVHFFFVISGFLITTLLLKEKNKSGSISLKKFYTRRFLRIFPVAYLYLLVLFILTLIFKVQLTWKSFISALLYVRNLPIFNISDWYTGHYWSLSVEEQFYLFVPWLIRKNIKIYITFSLSLLVLALFIRYLFFHGFSDIFLIKFLDKLIPNQAPIIVGSLIATLVHFQFVKIPKISGLYCLLLLILSMVIMNNTIYFIPNIISPIISSILLGLVIVTSIQHKKGWYYWIFNNWVIVKIGVLSYSIYIWQQLFTYAQIWHKYGGIWKSTFFNLILLTVVSISSYYLYERFFLKIKERFMIINS
jgi:peptidoglycan/LPS O-acetylase OafA/YrhL